MWNNFKAKKKMYKKPIYRFKPTFKRRVVLKPNWGFLCSFFFKLNFQRILQFLKKSLIFFYNHKNKITTKAKKWLKQLYESTSVNIQLIQFEMCLIFWIRHKAIKTMHLNESEKSHLWTSLWMIWRKSLRVYVFHQLILLRAKKKPETMENKNENSLNAAALRVVWCFYACCHQCAISVDVPRSAYKCIRSLRVVAIKIIDTQSPLLTTFATLFI